MSRAIDPTGRTAGNPAELARSFQALADEKRVRVLELLREGEVCVCDLAEALDVTQPLLSFHLRTLRNAGLVYARKQGRWVHYSLNERALFELQEVTGALAVGTFESTDGPASLAGAGCCKPDGSTRPASHLKPTLQGTGP